MKDYQKDLDKVKDLIIGEYPPSFWKSPDIFESLQELVGKEKPMKLKKSGAYDNVGSCPNCNLTIDIYGISYCPRCGQSLQKQD